VAGSSSTTNSTTSTTMWSNALCTLGVTKPLCNCLSIRQVAAAAAAAAQATQGVAASAAAAGGGGVGGGAITTGPSSGTNGGLSGMVMVLPYRGIGIIIQLPSISIH